MPTKAVCLGAGDSSVNVKVFTTTHREVIASKMIDVKEVADRHAEKDRML